MNLKKKLDPKIGAIFGNGRSGTTWLGSIVSSHPEVSYRFEPFHRLQKNNVEINETINSLRSNNFSPEDLSYIYKKLIPAYPECDKPPFFQKNNCFTSGKKTIWPIARKNYLIAYIFQRIYTPKKQAMLIFKEVAFVDLFLQLLKQTDIPVVYIVRHPCAVVSSTMRGQKKMLMSDKRRSVVQNLLEKHQPILAERYGAQLNLLEICEQEALLWLIDVERALSACQKYSNSLVIIYEQLSKQPLETSKKVFSHFGLEMTQQSISFIEESTKCSTMSRIKSGEVGINPYFTVFRDSDAARDRWKKEMTVEEQHKVMKIVEESNAFALYKKHSL